MKLVMTWYTCDETCGADYVQPFEYESIEKAEYDFLELMEANVSGSSTVLFAGFEFAPPDFFDREEVHAKKSGRITDIVYHYRAPTIQTLEDWWATYRT